MRSSNQVLESSPQKMWAVEVRVCLSIVLFILTKHADQTAPTQYLVLDTILSPTVLTDKFSFALCLSVMKLPYHRKFIALASGCIHGLSIVVGCYLQISESGFGAAASLWPDVFESMTDASKEGVIKELTRLRHLKTQGFEEVLMVNAVDWLFKLSWVDAPILLFNGAIGLEGGMPLTAPQHKGGVAEEHVVGGCATAWLLAGWYVLRSQKMLTFMSNTANIIWSG